MNDTQDIRPFDPVAFGQTWLDILQKARPVFEDYIHSRSAGLSGEDLDPMHIQPVYNEFIEKILENPDRFIELQQEFMTRWTDLWMNSWTALMSEEGKPLSSPGILTDRGDKRFASAEWNENALFSFIRQSYLLTCKWMDETVRKAADLDDAKKEKLAFHTRLFADAMAPTNFPFTNPDVIRETARTGGENLLKGLENFIDDLKRGHGELKISTTDYSAFEPGRNIAITPGAVVAKNELIELIQYAPVTDTVAKRPLLIIPPWINKYYILDLRPENSMIRWLVEQGHTVFVVSWVNPGAKQAQKRFEDYMQDGVLFALDTIRGITKEKDCNVIGYCLGGTLLAVALAWLAEHNRRDEIASATFLTTLIDFENAGDLKLFMDDEQLEMMDRHMAEKGVFEARQLQRTFNLLRSNDLIWSFVVNNYLLGREPFPFDLLYWNDDSTNMPAAMHSFYLRKMYRDNELTKPGGLTMFGTPIDIATITTPSWFLSTREDHIAPWKATYAGARLLKGPVAFTLAASGHIAGVVNPPDKNKYCHWTHDALPDNPDAWMTAADKHDGSWWPRWQSWIRAFRNGDAKARALPAGLPAAPGAYVKVRSA